MRKAVITVALLVAVLGMASPAAAQAAFGVRVGANFANLSFDPDDEQDTSTRTGLNVGGFASIPFNARFAFQPEVLYSQQGSKASEDGFEATLKLDYVNVPLLAKINLSSGQNPVSLLVGPQIGFRTGAQVESEGVEVDIEEQTESTDWGLVLGMSATLGKFVLDGRYTWGLSNINADPEDNQKVKNRVFTVSVGVMFR